MGDSQGAFWAALEYRLPWQASPARSSPDGASGAFLDPNVQTSLQFGGVLVFREWDVWAAYTIVDRGEIDRPEPRLPMLLGGFDQRQLSLGVQHRFGASD